MTAAQVPNVSSLATDPSADVQKAKSAILKLLAWIQDVNQILNVWMWKLALMALVSILAWSMIPVDPMHFVSLRVTLPIVNVKKVLKETHSKVALPLVAERIRNAHRIEHVRTEIASTLAWWTILAEPTPTVLSACIWLSVDADLATPETPIRLVAGKTLILIF